MIVVIADMGTDRMRWDQFGAAYDFPTYSSRPNVYLLASSGRSGSHLLANLLFRSGQAGSPLEYYHPKHYKSWELQLSTVGPTATFRALFRRRTSPSGWFGIKAHWPQFEAMLANPDFLKFLQIRKYVRLRRDDVVAQAVSMEIAKQTGSWISYQPATGPVEYDFEALNSTVRALVEENENWDAFFQRNGIQPLYVAYEELLTDLDAATEKVYEYLGIKFDPNLISPPGPQKQATERNNVWKERYLRECVTVDRMPH